MLTLIGSNAHMQFVNVMLQVTVLDGKTGKPVSPFLKSSAMANSSPLAVSMEGRGNDLFIYWLSDCIGHEGEGGKFEFVEGTNVHEQSRADTCRLRFNTKSFSKLYVTNRKIGFPGKQIYHSGTWNELSQLQYVFVSCCPSGLRKKKTFAYSTV